MLIVVMAAANNHTCVHGYVKQPDCTIVIIIASEKPECHDSLTLLKISRNVFLTHSGMHQNFVLPDKHDHTQHGSARLD